MNCKLIFVIIISIIFTFNVYSADRTIDSGGGWATDPASGCKVWSTRSIAEYEMASYSGECKDGIANGKGTLRWLHKGDRWNKRGQIQGVEEGYFLNGRLHGKGKKIWAVFQDEGESYIGEFDEGYMTGWGIKTLKCSCTALSCQTCKYPGIYEHGKLIEESLIIDGVTTAAEFRAWKKKEEKKNREAQALENAKYEKFRKSLAAGDESSEGIVIEVKGTIVKVQTNESQCTQRDNSNNCQNWISTPVEKWVKLMDVYPK